MIKVSNEITIYEINGEKTTIVPMPMMSVLSHWNQDSLVVLDVADRKVTVSARDLRAAIDNATNVARHG